MSDGWEEVQNYSQAPAWQPSGRNDDVWAAADADNTWNGGNEVKSYGGTREFHRGGRRGGRFDRDRNDTRPQNNFGGGRFDRDRNNTRPQNDGGFDRDRGNRPQNRFDGGYFDRDRNNRQQSNFDGGRFNRDRNMRPQNNFDGGRFDRDRNNMRPQNSSDGGRFDRDRNARPQNTFDGKFEKLLIPSKFVGRVIGRGGSKINELQNESGAKIQITKDTEGDETLVKLFGEEDAISKAKNLIDELTTDTFKVVEAKEMPE